MRYYNMVISKKTSLATLGLVLFSCAALADGGRVACHGNPHAATGSTGDASSAPPSAGMALSGTGIDTDTHTFGNDKYVYAGDTGFEQAALLSDWPTRSRISGRLVNADSDSGSGLDSQDSKVVKNRKRASRTIPRNVRPTPEPTGPSSQSTTVHIKDERDFALLLPGRAGELISDAESDGVSFCTTGSTDAGCMRRVQEGFIRAAAVSKSEDGSYIQVTGCLDRSKSSLDPSDSGGQFDVRFPNGAQCTFGGYGASFIQLVEPASNRFCLRCCNARDDQEHCNSHQDTAGCPIAIPGTYSFPSLGVSCDE